MTLGVAGGYSGTNFTQNDGETGDIQTIRGMVYAHYHAAPQILVDRIAGFAYDRIHTSRPIASLGTTPPRASRTATRRISRSRPAMSCHGKGFTVIPRVGAQYLHFAENRFSETGGSGFNLSRGAAECRQLPADRSA